MLTQAVVVKDGHLQAPVGHLVEAQVLPDQRLLPARRGRPPADGRLLLALPSPLR